MREVNPKRRQYFMKGHKGEAPGLVRSQKEHGKHGGGNIQDEPGTRKKVLQLKTNENKPTIMRVC